jgi:hypothetical protein
MSITNGTAILDTLMSEADLQSQVTELAEKTGWLFYHTYRSDRSPAGFPDLVLVRPPRLLFVELKKQRAKRTPAQDVWAEALEEVSGPSENVQYYCWRPSDWDEIVTVLR